MYIKKNQAKKLGKYFDIDFEIVSFDEWHYGLNVELEHGHKLGSLTNITNNSLKITARIVIAHLLEDHRYYFFLRKMEDKREKYWRNKVKPNIFTKFL